MMDAQIAKHMLVIFIAALVAAISWHYSGEDIPEGTRNRWFYRLSAVAIILNGVKLVFTSYGWIE